MFVPIRSTTDAEVYWGGAGALAQGFREASTVLKALVWMGARELASEPAIRSLEVSLLARSFFSASSSSSFSRYTFYQKELAQWKVTTSLLSVRAESNSSEFPGPAHAFVPLLRDEGTTGKGLKGLSPES